MGLLVRKYVLKEACEAREDSYRAALTRISRTRRYIDETASKIMPEDEVNVIKVKQSNPPRMIVSSSTERTRIIIIEVSSPQVFGFNPFDFKDPPPESVRELNKRKAQEDEEHWGLKSKHQKQK